MMRATSASYHSPIRASDTMNENSRLAAISRALVAHSTNVSVPCTSPEKNPSPDASSGIPAASGCTTNWYSRPITTAASTMNTA